MHIRPLTLEDYDALYALWLRCEGMGLNDIDDSRDGIARYLARNPGTCFAAEENGVLIGAVMAGHDGRRGVLYHTAVDPAHRGKGAGKALVEHALAALKNEGITKVNLVVFSRNEGGNAFWEKMGFSARSDLTYRNRALVELRRMDT